MTHAARFVMSVFALLIGLTACSSTQSDSTQSDDALRPPESTTPSATDSLSLMDFVPSGLNPDPTDQIDGVLKVYFQSTAHVEREEKVRYTYSPPFGGTHDWAWAGCTGVVYPVAIRNETAVHSLEHGAVWITYRPDLDVDAVDALAERVANVEYMLMSPYPGLDQPISVQSWGHQLKVATADDPRIDQFITATKQNAQSNVYPEDPAATAHPTPGTSCTAVPEAFDPADPPPFEPGAGTVPEG